MKRILILGALLGGWAVVGHAQGLGVWIEQLAALRSLEQTTQTCYQTVKNGLQTIGGIQGDEYQLHSTFYASLATVNPAVANDPKTAELRSLLNGMIQQLNLELSFWRKQEPIVQP
jgi:hypothetical protein